ncbi:uncharacterized protein DUF1573 [Desulfobotulus alkaliphilus]|nr:uncharacterized protein DUF1573 [Desulfobotulus alkaliphilus]
MSMKPVPFFYIFMLVCLTALPLWAKPFLHAPERVYTFDTLPEGSILTHRFTLHNTGDSELRILRVNPG